MTNQSLKGRLSGRSLVDYSLLSTGELSEAKTAERKGIDVLTNRSRVTLRDAPWSTSTKNHPNGGLRLVI